MAHKLVVDEVIQKRKRYHLPSMEGKYGLAIMVRGKSIFLGVEVSNVVVEKVVRKQIQKIPKSGVRVLRYDPNF